jgi:2-polyprenyl-3-methyl-5-hydroxy-6-metoxy-1,4-benzoquinol methylase
MTCYLCGSAGAVRHDRLTDQIFDVPGEWSLRQCSAPDCRLVWLDPCPVVEDIPKLYRTYYTHEANGRRDVLMRAYDRVLDLARPHVTGRTPPPGWRGWIGRRLAGFGPFREEIEGETFWLDRPTGGRWLDVGCGNGTYLVQLARRGWTAEGVEFDPAAAAVAARAGFTVRVGSLEQVGYPDSSFDVVSMSHVIEHLPDPVGTLTECRRILRPGGRIVLATPNAMGLGSRRFGRAWVGWHHPRHLFVFTPESLASAVERAGLTVDRLFTSSRSARVAWRISRQIEYAGRAPNYKDGFKPWRWPESYLFHLQQYYATVRRPAGEELILLVSRPA